ncbi:MAG: beta strand repeat-containing protein, partial [Stellaceae bacterium]
RVGRNNSAGSPNGVTPAGVTIVSAKDVDINIQTTAPNFDGFHVGTFTVQNAASLNAPDSYISTYHPSGDGGAVQITVSGHVEVGYDIFTAGGMNGTTGKNGGNVTIAAGASVQIGDAGVIAGNTSGSGADIIPKPGIIGIDTAGWFTGFAYTVTPNQTAGDGGSISIVAGTGGSGSINLPFGAFANGGSAIVNAAANATGGKAGDITLIANNGNVAVGSPTNGTVLGVEALGGSTVGNNKAGDGGTVSIFGNQISLTQVSVRGGDTTSGNIANTGAAGDIVLASGAVVGPAVILYGEADAPDQSPNTGTLVARGGRTGASVGSTPFYLTGGLTKGSAGAITIEAGHIESGNIVANDNPVLPNGAYIQLVDNTANSAYYGGKTVYISAAGGTPGAIVLNGAIEGTDNLESLRVQGGAITVGGAIGFNHPLEYVSFTGLSAMNLGGGIYTEANACGDADCPGSGNLGAVIFAAPVNLTADATIHAGGAVTFEDASSALESVDGAHALTIVAGGDVTLGDVGQGTPLTSLFVQGGDLSLQNVTTSGPQTYIDGGIGTHTIMLNGNLTDTTATDIALRGDTIEFNGDNIAIQTAGTVSSGNIVLVGTLDGVSTDSNILLNATNGLVWINQQIPGYNGFECPVGTCTQGLFQTVSGLVNVAELNQNVHILLLDDTTIYSNHVAGAGQPSLTITPSIDLAPGSAAKLTITEQGGAWGGIALNGVIGGGNAVGDLTIRTLGNSDNVALAGIGSSVLGGVLSGGSVGVEIDTHALTLQGNITTQGAPVTINASSTILATASDAVIDTG